LGSDVLDLSVSSGWIRDLVSLIFVENRVKASLLDSTANTHRGWILSILVPTSLAISIAVEEALNWIYLLRKSK